MGAFHLLHPFERIVHLFGSEAEALTRRPWLGRAGGGGVSGWGTISGGAKATSWLHTQLLTAGETAKVIQSRIETEPNGVRSSF